MTRFELECIYPAEKPCSVLIDVDSDDQVKKLLGLVHAHLKEEGYDVPLKELRLYKPDGLEGEPYETLQERCIQWFHTQGDSANYLEFGPRRLHKVFPEGPSEDMLHIIVADNEVLALGNTLGDPDARYNRKIRKDLDKHIAAVSSGLSPSETVKSTADVAKMTLNCIYPAEKPCIVIIDIDFDDRVENLLDFIHAQLKEEGYNVPLKELRLHKPDDLEWEPYETLEERCIQWLRTQGDSANLKDGTQLLDEVFPDDPFEDMLHIIVADNEVLALRDTLGNPGARCNRKIRKDLDKHIAGASSRYSPSKTVKSAETVNQFLDNRPIYMDRVPAAIFSPPLARLQRSLDVLEEVQVSQRIITYASALLGTLAECSPDATRRAQSIQDTMEEMLGGAWGRTFRLGGIAGTFTPHATWSYEYNYPIALLEIKHMLGIGDAILQAVMDYSKLLSSKEFEALRGICNFPAILIGLSGARLQVAAVVCAGPVYVSSLLMLDVAAGFQAAQNIVRLARVFTAFYQCLDDLREYYAGVAATTSAAANPGVSALYSSATPAGAADAPLPALAYRRFLGRSGQPAAAIPDLGSASSVLYIATLRENGAEHDVVVKFAPRYSERAHRILADAGLAPKLHHCRRVVGGVYMVVMEYIQGAKSVWQLCEERKAIDERVPGEVGRALALLHAEDIVFGDVRDVNVLYAPQAEGGDGGRVYLVDCDWAARDGEGRYPATLNRDNYVNDMRPYGIMQKAHDMDQLERLKARCRRGA